MARILLSHSYFYYFDPKQWRNKQPYPPLGTLYAASMLRNEGHEVIFFDNALEKTTAGFISKLKSCQPDVVVLYDDGFNYLTKMCLTNMRDASFEMTRHARSMNIPVFVSSSDATDQHEAYLKNGATAIIDGEGEITLKEALSEMENGEWNIVDGLIYLDEKGDIKKSARKVLRDLDELPAPAWDLLDMDAYRDIWIRNHGYFSLNFSTTRGCPYKCNWCAKPIYGNRYNSHSPQRVAREMKMLQDHYQVDHFWICDDIFGLKPNWVQDFAKAADDIQLEVRYKIQSRVDLMLKDDTLDALVRSGMDEVWVGAESGSQKILDAMDKGTTVEQIREATKRVKEKGRKICFFLQFGYPGEVEQDIRNTMNLLLELMPHDIGISVSYPLPGTVFYDRVKSDLLLKHNWTDSDDLDMMYQATYPRQFYRRLHRRVHRLYRRKQGLMYLKKLLQGERTFNKISLRSIFLSLFYYSPANWIEKWTHRQVQQVLP